MTFLKKAQAGFTLIEVVAAAALLGLLVTMAMPSLSAANAKVKNARLKSDLATIDQAIQLYVIDTGKVPTSLADLEPDYISKISDIKDAKGEELQYTGSDPDYTLSGKDTTGGAILSNGSKETQQTT